MTRRPVWEYFVTNSEGASRPPGLLACDHRVHSMGFSVTVSRQEDVNPRNLRWRPNPNAEPKDVLKATALSARYEMLGEDPRVALLDVNRQPLFTTLPVEFLRKGVRRLFLEGGEFVLFSIGHNPNREAHKFLIIARHSETSPRRRKPCCVPAEGPTFVSEELHAQKEKMEDHDADPHRSVEWLYAASLRQRKKQGGLLRASVLERSEDTNTFSGWHAAGPAGRGDPKKRILYIRTFPPSSIKPSNFRSRVSSWLAPPDGDQDQHDRHRSQRSAAAELGGPDCHHVAP